jgi:hypothetical protein
MTHTTITFSGDKVALIVRGKTDDDHSPGVMSQHADCATSKGAPVGYFGEGGEGSGYLTSAVLIGIKGEVYGLDEFEIHRPFYVDAAQARGFGVVSTALVVSVNNGEADKFDDYWEKLKADPGTFRLLGKNCSTRASGAFRHAGILSGGIPGLDTPNNLYKQLKSERADRCTSHSGYLGFQTAGNGFSMRIEPV